MTMLMSWLSVTSKSFMIQQIYLKMYSNLSANTHMESQFSKLMEWFEILYKKMNKLKNGTWLFHKTKRFLNCSSKTIYYTYIYIYTLYIYIIYIYILYIYIYTLYIYIYIIYIYVNNVPSRL